MVCLVTSHTVTTTKTAEVLPVARSRHALPDMSGVIEENATAASGVGGRK
jgi:hypothetical protein